MTSFTLTINTDNAAFEGDALPHEIARTLRKIARKIDDHGHEGTYGPIDHSVSDSNGNRVGEYSYDRPTR